MTIFCNKTFLASVPGLRCFVLLIFSGLTSFAQSGNLPGDILSYTEKLVLTNPDSAFFIVQKLHKQYEESGDVRSIAICDQQLGKIFHYQGAYAQALTYYLRAERTLRKMNDQLLIAQNLNNIAQTYSAAHLKQKSLPMFREALAIFQKLNNEKGIAKTYSSIGKLYETKGTYDLSYQYQEMALKLYRKIPDSLGMAKVYNDIGSILERKGRYKESLPYFEEALKINRLMDNRLGQIGNINNIGDIFRKTGDLKNAILTTNSAKDLAIELKNKRSIISAYDNLAATYKLVGRLDSAYFYSELGKKNYHETFKDESNRQINLLQTFFEVEKKNNEISQLKTEKRITRLYVASAVLVGLLLILLAYSVISRQRIKNRGEMIILETQKNVAEAELKNKLLQQNKLNEELETKSKELTSHTLHIIQKNQLLDDLRAKLKAIVKNDKRDQRKEIKQVIDLIENTSNQDKGWNDFRAIFEQVHINFFADLNKHCDGLTPADLRLLALLKMNLSSADIATMIGISPESLRTAKYRLRQKLQIGEGETLFSFVQQF